VRVFVFIVASFTLMFVCDDASACRRIWRRCLASVSQSVDSAQANVPPLTADQLELLATPTGRWPNSSSLDFVAADTKVVVAATATGPAKLGERYGGHISTQSTIGGRVIHGGGMIFSTECRQEFQVTEVLHGKAVLEKRAVEYSVTKSQAFPGPRSTSPVPAGAKAILLLGADGGFLKAIEDTPENRQAVRDALARKKVTPK